MHLVVILLGGLSSACHVGARRIGLGAAEKPKGSWESSRIQQTEQPFFARNEVRPQSRANLVDELRTQGILSKKGSDSQESSGRARGRRNEPQSDPFVRGQRRRNERESDPFVRGQRRRNERESSRRKRGLRHELQADTFDRGRRNEPPADTFERGRRNEPQADTFVRSPRNDEPQKEPPQQNAAAGDDDSFEAHLRKKQESKDRSVIDDLRAQYRAKYMDESGAQVGDEKSETGPQMQAAQTEESSESASASQNESQTFSGNSIDESQARARANMMEELKATLRTGSSEVASTPLSDRKPHAAFNQAELVEEEEVQAHPTGNVEEVQGQPEMALQVQETSVPRFATQLLDALSTLIQSTADFVDELDSLSEDGEHRVDPKKKEMLSNTQLQAQPGADLADELEAEVEGKKHKMSKRRKALQRKKTSEASDALPTEPQGHDAPSKTELQDQEWADLAEELEEHMMGKKRKKSKRRKKFQPKQSSETAYVAPTEPQEHDAPSKTELQSQSGADLADELEAQVEDKKHKSKRRKKLQPEKSSETADVPPTEPQEQDALSKTELQSQSGADLLDELEAQVEDKKHKSKRRKTLQTKESSETEVPPTEPQEHDALSKNQFQAQSEADIADELEAQVEGKKHKMSAQMKILQTKESSKLADVPPVEPQLQDAPPETQLQTQSGADPIHMETQSEGEEHEVSQQMKSSQTEEALETARVTETETHSHDDSLRAERTQSEVDAVDERVAQVEVDKSKTSLKTKASLRSSVKTSVPKVEIQSYDDALWKAKVRAQSGADFANELEEQVDGSPEAKPEIDRQLHETLGGVFGADFIDGLEAHLGGEHFEMIPQMNRPQAREPIKPELRNALGDVFGEDFVDKLETESEE